jgi:hypothetical protein
MSDRYDGFPRVHPSVKDHFRYVALGTEHTATGRYIESTLLCYLSGVATDFRLCVFAVAKPFWRIPEGLGP